MLTAEEIARQTDHKDGIANIRAINRMYREQDESDLYPVLNKFNATERAIRQAREIQANCGAVYGLEYCYLIENRLSEIVNSPNL